MRPKNPPTTFDQVRVTHNGDSADIEYLDPAAPGVHLSGVSPHQTDEEVFEHYNNGLLEIEAHRLRNPYFAQEIPLGEPQIEHSALSDQWSATGDVVRGIIGTDDDGQVSVEIDDHNLSLREFGSLLSVHMGWGLRLVFVPDDEIHRTPTIKVGHESWGWRDEGEEPKPAHFIGEWRITDMELWDQDAVDLLGPAYFHFDGQGQGSFRFVALEGAMDCRYGQKDGRPFAEFSWLGDDDGERKNGRGWAVIRDDGTLEGRFYTQQGDDSAFKARKSDLPLRPPFKPERRVRRGRR
ncbi:MAG: DUF7713 domain-containing protein [bacterium]